MFSGETPAAEWAMHAIRSVARKATCLRNTQRAARFKRATSHTFRHSFATHLLETGYDIRTVQEFLDRKDVKTMMIYTHVLNRGGNGVKSPADDL